ncbi:Long-chain-fatty-acid--CoA ligase 6, partial [Pseudolycoriella hygida]
LVNINLTGTLHLNSSFILKVRIEADATTNSVHEFSYSQHHVCESIKLQLQHVFVLVEDMDYLQYIGGLIGVSALTGVAAASAYLYVTRPLPEVPLVPLHDQSPILEMPCCTTVEPIRVPIDMSKQSEIMRGPEQIHVSKFYKESKNGKFVNYISEDAQTLYETFRKGAYESNNGPCLGWRESLSSPYSWMNFNETLLRAKNFGSGLIEIGIQPRSLVGVYSQNRPEWVLFEQGAYCYSLVVVPLYDTLGPDACAFIIKQTDMSTIIVDDDKKANLLLDKAPRGLKKLITIQSVRPATLQRAKNRGVDIHTFDEIERLGAQGDHPEVAPTPDDICTICYTSGTTGNPKGVTLTHKNVVAGVCAVLLQLGEHRPGVNDVMMSFLPLAHMLERW